MMLGSLAKDSVGSVVWVDMGHVSTCLLFFDGSHKEANNNVNGVTCLSSQLQIKMEYMK